MTPELPKASPPKPGLLEVDASSAEPPPAVLTGLAYLALGLLTCLATVLVHDRTVGLVVGLIATAAILVGSTPRWWARLAYSVGWVLAMVYSATPRTEGDYLLGRDTADYVVAYVATPIVLVFGLVTTVLAARLRREPAREPSPTDPT